MRASSSHRAGISVRGLPCSFSSLLPAFIVRGASRSPGGILTGVLVAYALGIYLLNLFLAFLTPKFDPSNEAIDNEMEDGSVGTLPTKQDEEFRPFIRRLPEFKFWHSATRAITIAFVCSWFSIFDVPVFWPVLVMYWFMLFILTSAYPSTGFLSGIPNMHIVRSANSSLHYSAETNSAHDQVPLRAFLHREDTIHQVSASRSLDRALV